MQNPKHIVVIAGEESGDAHAASFITRIKNQQPDIYFSGIGGKHMHEAGVDLISDLAKFGVTGFSEVLKHFRTIRQAFIKIKLHLNTNKPDLIVLVDYPGFNLRLAKYAKEKLNIRILYYISPQIWAWKAKRINIISRYIDHMAVILPFEKDIYKKAGVPVSFVGHPVIDKINSCLSNDKVDRKDLVLPNDKRLIAALPGSRINEIERHMPVIAETAKRLSKQFNDLHFVIPIARTINKEIVDAYMDEKSCNYTLIDDRALEVVKVCDYCIVASGTASLEAALLSIPMCIIYKASFLTYIAASKLIKVKYIGLSNLLQNKMAVSELLQYDCNADELTFLISSLIKNNKIRNKMINQHASLRDNLSISKADISIEDLILSELLSHPSKKE